MEKTAVVSGSGNVATYCIEKLIQSNAKVVTASDSGGFIHDPDGINEEKLSFIKELKEVRRGRISEYVDKFPSATYHQGERPWGVPCELAFPCATQNEVTLEDAKTLLSNGMIALSEGANMPTDIAGMHAFQQAKVMFAPAKAANAGWSSCFWIGTKPELASNLLVARRGQFAVASDHEEHSRHNA